jgi:hypothetical protein
MVRIRCVQLHAVTVPSDLSGDHRIGDQRGDVGQEWSRDECLASRLDGVKSATSPLTAQRFEFLNGCGLSEVVAKNGDVDVFGEAINQCERLRQRSSAFEQQARRSCRQAIEENVERPADPEIFLDVLNGGAESAGCGQEQVATRIVAGGDHVPKGRVHHGRGASIGLRCTRGRPPFGRRRVRARSASS